MAWPEVFIVFALSHLMGDFLLQTDWQAQNKAGGIGPDHVARRALALHVATYTLAFVPALIWVADHVGAGALGIAALIAVPHFVQDDGRLIAAYVGRVKGPGAREVGAVMIGVDQALHMLALFGAALLAAA